MPRTSAKPTRALFLRFETFLATKNLKQTKQRQAILGIFLDQKGHITAEELYNIVKEHGHNIGFATIYRTLNLLTEGGFVDQKQFTDGQSVFEIKTPGEHHDHLVCLKCQKVVEFENHQIEALQIEVAKQYNFTLKNHTLNLFGYCQDCGQNTH